MAASLANPEVVAAMESIFNEPPTAHFLITEITVRGLDGPGTTTQMRQGLAWVDEQGQQQRMLLQRRRGGEPSIIDPGNTPIVAMDASLLVIHNALMRHWRTAT